MLDNYLNQTLTWKVSGTPNEYNETTPVTKSLIGRMESTNKLKIDKDGREYVVNAIVFTKTLVTRGDLIENRLVVSVEPMIDLDGRASFYEVGLQ